jgi:hypothetical protein
VRHVVAVWRLGLPIAGDTGGVQDLCRIVICTRWLPHQARSSRSALRPPGRW